MSKTTAVDTYIGSFPPEVQLELQSLRETIRHVLPTAQETMSYGIPCFKSGGKDIVFFAGWKKHLSIYPILELDEGLEREVAPFRAGRGTLRFTLGQPLPLDLVERVVTDIFRRRVGDSG